MHKEFVPEGKTVNTEFYKGVMDRLLKRFQRVRPAAFGLEIVSCCTIMGPPPPQSCKCLPIFDIKDITILNNPPYNPYLSQPHYFFVPEVENDVKRLQFSDVADIQEAVTDELKKVQKEEY